MKKLTVIGFFRGLARILRARPRVPAPFADNPTLALLWNRRSVRKYRAEDISGDELNAILEAGRLAPSTVNLQTWSFGVFGAYSTGAAGAAGIDGTGRPGRGIPCGHQPVGRLCLRYAWPSASWGSLPLEGGIEAAYRAEIDAADDPQAKLDEIEERLNRLRSPFRTAESFWIDEVIDPRDTRRLLCDFANLAAPLREPGPSRFGMRP